MHTNCPKCYTQFRVTAEQLKAAAGNVRCSNCNGVFNAVTHLADRGQAPEAGAPQPEVEIENDKEFIDVIELIDDKFASEEESDETSAPRPEPPPLIADDLRAFEKSRRRGWRPFLWFCGVLVLGAVLAVQAGYFMRDQLNHYVWMQPWLNQLCEVVECKVQIPRDLDAIKVSERDIRRHPSISNALLINVTIANNADFQQPYPVMILSFSDVSGNAIARRYFKPAEYLGNTNPEDDLMPSKTPVLVVLEIVDPGDKAVSFQFDFL